ncbi:hypothetical protein [Palleronia caenipelagi]|uniref:Uncharacterized protein n=1 Tax=Palleronia caenipelagi TaxID=2489174 RepID=A0A547PN60_9RHOB|nr:hypothetical protein [Palleronia caenipelagi]TRD15560.1 hypothetical protein FEV53_15865 [Palleronia caenipelagi]
MGEGLYWSQDGRTVYVEPFEGLDAGDVDLWDWAYEDLIDVIGTCLTERWSGCEGAWRDHTSRIVARNTLHEIWLTQDSYDRVHVTFGVREHLYDLDALARHHVDDRAERFFDLLQEHYALRVRTSPWTSAPRERLRMAG